MAGATMAYGGMAPAGMQWDPTRGGFVSKSAVPRIAAADQADRAELTRPRYETSPLGEVTQFNATTGAWDTRGNLNNTGPAATGRVAAASGGDDDGDDYQRKAALQGLISQIGASPAGTYTPAQIAPITTSGATGGSPYDLAGEDAAYGAAKERTGLAIQAAMKGLRSQLSQRGIMGSGIEADMTGDLYARGLSELGATDRQLAETRAGRAFTAGQADTDRTIQQNTYNVGAQNEAGQFNADAARQRQELIARLTQMMY